MKLINKNLGSIFCIVGSLVGINGVDAQCPEDVDVLIHQQLAAINNGEITVDDAVQRIMIDQLLLKKALAVDIQAHIKSGSTEVCKK